MTSQPLPKAAEPAYLTEVLRCCGALRGGTVREVAVESEKTTILSRIIRLRPVYDGAAADAPAPLLLKTVLPERAAIGLQGGRHEVDFYARLAPELPPGLVPRCFDAACDEAANEWHLLLEDLTETHATLPVWPLPPTLDDSRRIVAAWARFHAAWWDDVRLGVSLGTWLEPHDPQLQRFAEQFACFADRLGDRLSPERRAVYEAFIANGHALNARYHIHRNMTIVHGDSHVWNVFLPREDGSGDVRLFDWDCWRVDVATDDLAYMMALHWYPDHRHRFEPLLLDHYHTELKAHGVTGYDRRALGDDYRLSVLCQLATPVWQAAYDIPPFIWWNHLERIFMAIDDLGCRELLGP